MSNNKGGKGRLVVLGLHKGHSFPGPKSPRESLYIAARLDTTWLQTEMVAASTDPDFNTELVWELDRKQMAALRSSKAVVKVKCLLCKLNYSCVENYCMFEQL